jgi:hypothetical protein
MSDSHSPKRWLAGGAPADPVLSRVLASATNDEPDAEALHALSEKLETALALAPAALAVSAANVTAGGAGAVSSAKGAVASAANVTAGAASSAKVAATLASTANVTAGAAGAVSSAKAAGAVALWKVGISIVVGGGLVGGAIHYGRGSDPAALVGAPAHTTIATAEVIPESRHSSAKRSTAELPVVPMPSAEPAIASRGTRKSRASAQPAVKTPSIAPPEVPASPVEAESDGGALSASPARTAPSPADEVLLVERAQTSLRHGSTHEALALANRHSREHPNGAVTQESEAIAIEALYRLGRRAEADARRARFRARFPSSPHLRRINELAARAASSP